MSLLFERDLPRGQYYFLLTLRKLAYLLIKENIESGLRGSGKGRKGRWKILEMDFLSKKKI